MAKVLATRASRGHRTLCLHFAEEGYLQSIHDPAAFRRAIDDRFRTMPELFRTSSPTDTGSGTIGARPRNWSRSDGTDHGRGAPSGRGTSVALTTEAGHLARTVLDTASLSPDANVLILTLMATKMPFVSRG